MKTNTKAYKPKNDGDDYNPAYLFSTTATDLLVGIALGQIDPHELALEQLRSRGQDPTDGEWVGFPGHGRLEKLMKRHNFKVKPVVMIQRDLQANADEFTDKERKAMLRIIELMKGNNELVALEIALISGQTVQYYTLSELKK